MSLRGHPLFTVGKSASQAPEQLEAGPLLGQFNAAIAPYSTDRSQMDWPLVERIAAELGAQRCDLKVYSYLALAAFHSASEDESPYLPLGAVLCSLGDLIEQAWERCIPKLEGRRQAQLKWLSEELSAPLKTRTPKPNQRQAFLDCLNAAERTAELAGNALGLGYPILRELREALKEHERALPAPPAPPPAQVQAAPPPVAPPVSVAPPAPPPVVVPATAPSPPAVAAPAPPAPTPVDPSQLSRDALEDQLASLVIQLASQLRADSLTESAPYWMLRALRWANHDLLRPERIAEVLANKGRSQLPLPQGHGRLIKDFSQRLAAGQHADVVSECEELFALNPLWLDLQRFIANGLEALGAEQARAAVRGQLGMLLRLCPQITELRFSDRDATPFADSETQRWLEGERSTGEAEPAAQRSMPPSAPEQIPEGLLPGVQFLQKQILHAQSGARRFEVQLRLVELLLSNQRSDIAMPVVELLLAAIESHRLVEWQPDLCQHALRLAVQTARAAELDAARRAQLWTRVCQLAPAEAVQLGPEILTPV